MTKIHPTAEVESSAIGSGTVIWHYCHVRENAKIGKNCSLGRNVYIDEGVVIGNNVRIQNNVSVYKGVWLEDYVFVGPHVVFTNDKRPRVGKKWSVCETRIKEGASIGAGAVIVCGFEVGEYAMIGAGAVVCRNIKAYELVTKFSEHVGYVTRTGEDGEC